MQVPVRRKPGDWDCPSPSCGEMNFGSRAACRKCSAPRPQSTAAGQPSAAPQVRRKPGDWDCPSPACTEMNFGSRSACRKCGAARPPGQAGETGSAGGRRRGGGRGGGRGLAVALHSGNHTHITMVYVKSLGDRSKQDALAEAARWANGYWQQLQANGESSTGMLALEVGSMWGPNSIHVTGVLAHAKASIIEHFNSNGWEVDNAPWGTTPHINLKGCPSSILNSHVDIFNGWMLI